MNLRRVAAVASKEWRETVRDRMFLLLAFVLPALWIVVFGYGLVFDVESIPFAVLDRDRTNLSRDYLHRFIESRYFSFRGYLGSEREVDRVLQRADIRAAILISEKFQERLSSGKPVSVQFILDGTFPLHTDITKGYVIAINSAFSEEMFVSHLGRTHGLGRERAQQVASPVKLEVRYLYNEEVRSSWSMVPALIMFTLLVSSPLLTALGIVREKESGSIYNIYSSTVSRLEFIIGKLAPHVFITAVNVVILWLMAVILFQVPFKGSILFLFCSSVLFILCSTGIGLVVSLLVRTQMAALIIVIVFAMVPTMLFSGLYVPVPSLSRGAQLQAHLFPGMYYTNILRGTFLKGVGLEVLWLDVVALAVFGGALLAAGYALFTKRPPA